MIDSSLIANFSTFLGVLFSAELDLTSAGFESFARIEMTRARGTSTSPNNGERIITVMVDDWVRISPMSCSPVSSATTERVALAEAKAKTNRGRSVNWHFLIQQSQSNVARGSR